MARDHAVISDLHELPLIAVERRNGQTQRSEQHTEIQHDQILGQIILALIGSSIRESVLQIDPDALPECVHGGQASCDGAGFKVTFHLLLL